MSRFAHEGLENSVASSGSSLGYQPIVELHVSCLVLLKESTKAFTLTFSRI